MVIVIKTKQGDHHPFDGMKKATKFICEYPDDVKVSRTYDSILEYIKDEYMFSDLRMGELLRSIAKELDLDNEIILASLCYAGEEDSYASVVHDIIEYYDERGNANEGKSIR